jgi:uncharacterized protein (DUF934 family)
MPPLEALSGGRTGDRLSYPLRRGAGREGNPVSDRSAISPSPSRKGGRDDAARSGTPDPDGLIWRDGAFWRDTWAKAQVGEVLPDAPVIVAKKLWLAERDHLGGRSAALGLLVAAGESVDDLASDLARFALIALDFPKFADGRAFSTARLLRDKYGFAGELRAVGNVLADQVPFMRRVGFDSYEVTSAPTRRALAEGRIADMTLHYQPAASDELAPGARPWLRRTP